MGQENEQADNAETAAESVTQIEETDDIEVQNESYEPDEEESKEEKDAESIDESGEVPDQEPAPTSDSEIQLNQDDANQAESADPEENTAKDTAEHGSSNTNLEEQVEEESEAATDIAFKTGVQAKENKDTDNGDAENVTPESKLPERPKLLDAASISESMKKQREEQGWLSKLDVDAILSRKSIVDTYIHASKELCIVPASFFVDRQSSTEIKAPFHGGAQAIAQVLALDDIIERLDLTANSCGEGGFYIAQSLRTNSRLVYLDLRKNFLGCHAGKEFSEMLTENSTLQVLILQGEIEADNFPENQISDDEATHLAAGLRNNSTLTTLDLSYNNIGDIGASELGSGLAINSALRELNLSWNHIRPRGINSMFSNMQSNSGLNNLNIDSNGIGDSGQFIASYLQRSNAIQLLTMSHSRISDTGITAISKGIETSQYLKEVDCSHNSFSDDSVPFFFKALAACQSLRKIFFGKEGRARIDDLRQQRPELEIVE